MVALSNVASSRRRHCYRTRSNIVKGVKTPGGRLATQYIAKTGTSPKCGDCGTRIFGVPALRPRQYHRISKRQKHVTRSYGGSRCAGCVRQRIVRAFLIEEQRNVKLVLAAEKKKQAAAAKKQK